MTEFAPQRFGRYELLQRLAVGGMAEVFLARMLAVEGAEKPLVIKRVLPNLARNREFIERFIDEARIALPLTHDAITAVFDFGRVEDDYFIAMEYVEGPDLGTTLARLKSRGEQLPIPIALHVAAQIASGLNYAHRATAADGGPAGIVHRDVSPQNILLAFNGAVKLTDFGIARARSRLEITSSLVRGKPCYLSPEQAKGESTDGRSDLFSLGVVLHEMLTGQRVFEDRTPLATLQRIMSAEIPLPSKVREGTDAEVDAIVLKALARAPEGRYQDGKKLQGDLTRALHRMAPGFTADGVTALLVDLFPEKAGEVGTGGRGTVPLRDRLVTRLANAGAGVDPEKMTTNELLRLNTVAVPVLAPVSKEAPRRAPRSTVPPAPPRPAEPRMMRAGPRGPVGAIAGAIAAAGAAVAFVVWLAGGLAGEDSLVPRGTPPPRLLTSDPSMTSLVAVETPGTARATSEPGSTAPRSAASSTASGTTASTTTAHAAVPGGGTIHITALPWANVWVDGVRLKGHTPIRDVRLRPGAHKVYFLNPVLALEFTKTVVVESGSVQTVTADLEMEGRPVTERAAGEPGGHR